MKSTTKQKPCITCGRKVPKRNCSRSEYCRDCAEVERLSSLKRARIAALEYKQELRKWYKWICRNDLYEPSVRIKGVFDSWETQDLRSRCVLEITPYYGVKNHTITEGWLAGAVLDYAYAIDGYFRMRTDRDYYPTFGKAGIPHEKLSGAAKDFKREFWEGRAKEREIKQRKQYEADAARRGEALREKQALNEDAMRQKKDASLEKYRAGIRRRNESARRKRDACLMMTALHACQELINSQKTQPTN